MLATRKDNSALADWEHRLASLLQEWGYELIEFQVQQGAAPRLKISMDRLGETAPTCQVTFKDCETVSHALSDWLDQSTEGALLFPAAYTLEVSSPGVQRPLKKRDHLERFLGQRMRGLLRQPFLLDETGQFRYPASGRGECVFCGILRELGPRTPEEKDQALSFSVSLMGKKHQKKVSALKKKQQRGGEPLLVVPWSEIVELCLEPEWNK